MGKCSVQNSWFNQKDPNGFYVKEWAAKITGSMDKLFCKVCSKQFSIVKGFYHVQQHAKGEEHKKLCRTKLDSNQMVLEKKRPEEVEVGTGTSSGFVSLISRKDAGMKAALIWAMKVATSNYSFASSNDVEEIMRTMFPADDAVPKDFSVGSTKVQYLITEALGPHFLSELIQDIRQSFVTALYDETTNNESMKELVIALRYCSSRCELIVTHHLRTYFMGSATAKELAANVIAGLGTAGLSLKRLLMLGSDGPNVNKAVEKLINQEVLTLREKPLADVGTCPIHIVHNAFLKGLEELGEDASEFIICAYNYLDGWPGRQEEYSAIQDTGKLPKHKFLKHLPARWLTLGPEAQRLLEQMPAVRKYFLSHLKEQRPKLCAKRGCQKIIQYLKRPTLKAELLFVIASAEVFTKFTATFQKDEPLVHLLYSELKLLFKTLALRVCKLSAWDKLGISERIFESSNFLPLKDIVWDQTLSSEIAAGPEKERLIFLKNAQKHIIAAAKHILQKSPLKNPLVRSLRCLSPDAKGTGRSKQDVLVVARSLPVDVHLDVLADEWMLMQSEPGIEEKIRVDEYWQQFYGLKHLTSTLKYPSLSEVVKAALTLSHGNATVERMFSISGQILTSNRASMMENTLNSLNMIQSGFKAYDSKAYLLPITRELLALGYSAHAKYVSYLEAEKKEAKKRRSSKKRLENVWKRKNALKKRRRKIAGCLGKMKPSSNI